MRDWQRREGPVLNWAEPEQCVKDAANSCPVPPLSPDVADEWMPRFRSLVQTVLQRGQNLHHPYYVGHQVPASIPIASLFDAIGTMCNQVMAIYEMGPWATAVERAMIAHVGGEIGYPAETFGGLITQRRFARESYITADSQKTLPSRMFGETESAIQNDWHSWCKTMCIIGVTRSAGILGIGTDQIIRIPVDQHRKMKVGVLDETLTQLEMDGRIVVAVVAGACSTTHRCVRPAARNRRCPVSVTKYGCTSMQHMAAPR